MILDLFKRNITAENTSYIMSSIHIIERYRHSDVARCQTVVLHITNVGPPLDLLATVGKPVVHF